MSTADDRMARYELVAAAANVEGFRHLAPAGGVDDPSAAYFFQVSRPATTDRRALALLLRCSAPLYPAVLP